MSKKVFIAGLGLVLVGSLVIVVLIPDWFIETLLAGLFLFFVIGLAGAFVRGKDL